MEESDMPLNSKENADMRSDETESETVDAHPISSVSNTSDGISFLEEVSSYYKPEDEFSSSKTSSINERSEVSFSEKSFCRSSSVDRLMPFDAESTNKSPIPSGIEEKYLDNRLCNKHTNIESEETYSESFISDASNRTSLLLAMPSGYKPKDGSLLSKQASFNNEITEPTSSYMLSYTNVDNKSPDPATPFSGTKGNGGFPVSLSCSYLFDNCNDNEDLNFYSEKQISLNSKENIKMSFENNASKRNFRNSESDETHSLSSDEDIFSGTLSLEKMSTNYKQRDGSLASKMSTRDQIEFLLPYNSPQPFSLNNRSSNNWEDIASPDPGTPSSVIYDNNNLSSCSSIDDYYVDDEDLERFCERDMNTQEKIKLEAKALKVENNNSIGESLASSDKSCITPTSKHPTQKEQNQPLNKLERDLLVQVQKFFSENPMVDKLTYLN